MLFSRSRINSMLSAQSESVDVAKSKGSALRLFKGLGALLLLWGLSTSGAYAHTPEPWVNHQHCDWYYAGAGGGHLEEGIEFYAWSVSGNPSTLYDPGVDVPVPPYTWVSVCPTNTVVYNGGGTYASGNYPLVATTGGGVGVNFAAFAGFTSFSHCYQNINLWGLGPIACYVAFNYFPSGGTVSVGETTVTFSSDPPPLAVTNEQEQLEIAVQLLDSVTENPDCQDTYPGLEDLLQWVQGVQYEHLYLSGGLASTLEGEALFDYLEMQAQHEADMEALLPLLEQALALLGDVDPVLFDLELLEEEIGTSLQTMNMLIAIVEDAIANSFSGPIWNEALMASIGFEIQQPTINADGSIFTPDNLANLLTYLQGMASGLAEDLGSLAVYAGENTEFPAVDAPYDDIGQLLALADAIAQSCASSVGAENLEEVTEDVNNADTQSAQEDHYNEIKAAQGEVNICYRNKNLSMETASPTKYSCMKQVDLVAPDYIYEATLPQGGDHYAIFKIKDYDVLGVLNDPNLKGSAFDDALQALENAKRIQLLTYDGTLQGSYDEFVGLNMKTWQMYAHPSATNWLTKSRMLPVGQPLIDTGVLSSTIHEVTVYKITEMTNGVPQQVEELDFFHGQIDQPEHGILIISTMPKENSTLFSMGNLGTTFVHESYHVVQMIKAWDMWGNKSGFPNMDLQPFWTLGAPQSTPFPPWKFRKKEAAAFRYQFEFTPPIFQPTPEFIQAGQDACVAFQCNNMSVLPIPDELTINYSLANINHPLTQEVVVGVDTGGSGTHLAVESELFEWFNP